MTSVLVAATTLAFVASVVMGATWLLNRLQPPAAGAPPRACGPPGAPRPLEAC